MFGGDILLMKYALIDSATDEVVNMIVVDDLGGWTVPDGNYIVETESAEIGDIHRGGIFDSQVRIAAADARQADLESRETERNGILVRLGITEDEFRSLL